MSLQVCGCCGWSKVTSYQGLRTHQGKKGCTPKGMSIPQSEQYRFTSFAPTFTLEPAIKVEKPLVDIFPSSIKPVGEQNTLRTLWGEPIHSTPVRNEPFQTPVSQAFNMQTNLAAAEAIFKDTYKSVFETPPRSYHTPTSAFPALDFSTGAQQPFLTPVSQTLNVLKETNKSLFETPQHSYHTTTNARRALDFSTGAQQVLQLPWLLQTTTAQETAVGQQESEREREREAQKLQKARQDKIRADLQKEIQMREQKMAEVRSSAEAFKDSLDTECQEINKVFLEVMRVVQDTWKTALQPLEERRHRVRREAQDLVEKLQKETDKLKRTMDELDQNPDFQVSPLTGLDESRNWENVDDVSFSLGTLRSQTSNMMKQIQQNLEKLSAVELKRIPTFAVDVKLDPNTAHRCLALSLNGKEVTDGGTNPRVPAGPERFDMFGSVLGLNRLISGKSYWEVEVSNKSGWDLGVARRKANRKGKLSLTPGNGYWVTVHYEDEKYAALSDPPVSLSLPVKPQKVGVFVDYEEGLVSFYNVTAQSHIYSFTECSFNDKICPYFSPHLRQNEKNSDPLVISAVKKH